MRVALQEGLSNALRHASATHIEVRWHTSGPALVVQVTDNGVGMEASAPGQGLGLASVEARLAELGGRVDWQRAEPQGTTVSLQLPLR